MACQLWDHPRHDILLEHHEKAEQYGQQQAMLEGAR
jgi:hypothetical protein